MSFTPEQIAAGQAGYTKKLLPIYDFIVLGLSNHLIWKCPTQHLEALYNQHITPNHLDIGVGTGYFLDRCEFPAPHPRIALMDLNPNSLEFTARRIARYKPECYQCNVLAPIELKIEKFDSVGINYLLHCLPGSIELKSIAFEYLKPLMNPGAVLFGSTLLQGGVPRSAIAKRLMQFYNQKGIFSNQADSLAGLTQVLNQHFSQVNIQTIGCAALFSAHAQVSRDGSLFKS